VARPASSLGQLGLWRRCGEDRRDSMGNSVAGRDRDVIAE
jgi:hypothetical protein